MSKHDFPTIEYENRRYAIVPAIVKGYCEHCEFDDESRCPHTTRVIHCESSKPETDNILVRDTPEGIANYVLLRME